MLLGRARPPLVGSAALEAAAKMAAALSLGSGEGTRPGAGWRRAGGRGGEGGEGGRARAHAPRSAGARAYRLSPRCAPAGTRRGGWDREQPRVTRGDTRDAPPARGRPRASTPPTPRGASGCYTWKPPQGSWRPVPRFSNPRTCRSTSWDCRSQDLGTPAPGHLGRAVSPPSTSR